MKTVKTNILKLYGCLAVENFKKNSSSDKRTSILEWIDMRFFNLHSKMTEVLSLKSNFLSLPELPYFLIFQIS